MIEINPGEYVETSDNVLYSTAFICCIGIYVIGEHYSSLGHIETSTSYEFDKEFKHSTKFYQAMNTIIKNKSISDNTVYWGLVNGIKPYPPNNPNIMMVNDSIGYLEEYFKEKKIENIVRIKDITSFSITIDHLKKEIKNDSNTIKVNNENKSRNV